MYPHYKAWDEITDQFPNFNDAMKFEVWRWISSLIPHYTSGPFY